MGSHDTVRVRFVKRDAPFEPGDEKDCSRGEAEKLQRQGVAVVHPPPLKQAAKKGEK